MTNREIIERLKTLHDCGEQCEKKIIIDAAIAALGGEEKEEPIERLTGFEGTLSTLADVKPIQDKINVVIDRVNSLAERLAKVEGKII